MSDERMPAFQATESWSAEPAHADKAMVVENRLLTHSGVKLVAFPGDLRGRVNRDRIDKREREKALHGWQARSPCCLISLWSNQPRDHSKASTEIDGSESSFVTSRPGELNPCAL